MEPHWTQLQHIRYDDRKNSKWGETMTTRQRADGDKETNMTDVVNMDRQNYDTCNKRNQDGNSNSVDKTMACTRRMGPWRSDNSNSVDEPATL